MRGARESQTNTDPTRTHTVLTKRTPGERDANLVVEASATGMLGTGLTDEP